MPIICSLGAISARALGLANGVVALPPNILSISGNDNGVVGGQIYIYFNPGKAGTAPVTNYEVSTDDGSSWTTLDPADITSPLIFSGLTNGTTYTVRIRSLQGSQFSDPSNAITVRPVALPAAPTISSIDDDTNGTVGTKLVVYYSVTDGTDPVDHASMQYSVDNGLTWQTRSDGESSSPLTISSLTNGSSYNVKVRSVTTIGDVSTGSSTVTARPVKLPGAPTLTSVTTSTGYVYYNFTAGTAGTDSTVTYEYSIDDGVTWIAPSPSTITSPIAVATLGSGSSYTPGAGFYDWNISEGDYDNLLRLRAVTTQSHVSAASSAVSPTVTLPGTPPVPSVTSTPSSLTFSWTDASSGSYALAYYEYSTNNSTWTAVGSTTSSKSVTFSGLSPSTSYTRYFRTRDIFGNISATRTASGTTSAETPPSTPSAPSVSAASTTSLSVNWSTSSAGSYPISYYQYRYKLTSVSTWGSATTISLDPFTISSLSVDTSYDVQIRAVASSGTTSSWSSTGTGVTNPGVPSAPTLSFASTSASERSIASLSWTSPTYATSYQVFRDGSINKTISATSTTVTVTVGKTHTFYVKARNRLGQVGSQSNTKTMTVGNTNIALTVTVAGPRSLGLIGSCGTTDANALVYSWGTVPSSSATAGWKQVTYVQAEFSAYEQGGLLTLSSGSRNTYIDVSSSLNRISLTGGLNVGSYLTYGGSVNVSGSSLSGGKLKLYGTGSGYTSYTSSCVPNDLTYSLAARNLRATGIQTTSSTYS